MKYSKTIAALLGVSLLAGQFFLPSVQASQTPAEEHMQVETAQMEDEVFAETESPAELELQTDSVVETENAPLPADPDGEFQAAEEQTELAETEPAAETESVAAGAVETDAAETVSEETDAGRLPSEQGAETEAEETDAAETEGAGTESQTAPEEEARTALEEAACVRERADGSAGTGSALGTGTQVITHEQIAASSAWQHKDAIKARIRQTADQCGTTIDLSEFALTAVDADGNYTADWEALKEIFWDAADAEYFFLTGNYTCYFDADGGRISRISLGQSKVNGRNVYGYLSDYRSADGTPDAEKIREDRQRLADIVSRAVEFASASDTDLGRILLLHDFLVSETDYDQEAYLRSIRGEAAVPSIDYTAFGALVNRTAMCNGYALAFSLLMQKLGLQSYIIASDALNHAWNMVVIDDQWYNLDTTRDDSRYMNGTTYYQEMNADYTDLGAVSHYYFLYSDAELEEKYGGMYDSYIQCSSEEKPVSHTSAPFSNDYIFRTLSDANFSYGKEEGSWYVFSLKDQSLYRSPSLLMKDAQVIWQDPDARYGVVYQGLLYYNTEDGIYSYDPASGRTHWLLGLHEGEEKITEMVMRGGEITYVVLGEDGSRQTTVPVSQLVGILVVPPEKEKEEEVSEALPEPEETQADRKDDAAEPAADQAEETEADLSAQPDTREAALHEPLARDKDASASETAAQQDLDIVLLSNIARGAARISGSFLPGR